MKVSLSLSLLVSLSVSLSLARARARALRTVDMDWTPILKETCDKAGISFFTSPYDLDIVDQVESAVGLSSQTDEVDKNTLAQLLMQACIDASRYCETSDFSALVNRYNQYHLHHGQVINYRLEDQTHNAVVLGISVNGHLIVRNGDQDLYLHAEQISHVRSASLNRSAVYSLSDTRVS